MNLSPFQKRMTVFGSVALLAVAAAAGWSITDSARAQSAGDANTGGGKKGDKPKAPPPVQVTSVKVAQEDLPIFRSGIGTVTPQMTVVVKTRVDGQLDRVGFTEGQDVKAGQMLAELDPRALRAALAQAQAVQARDEATLGNARVDLGRYTSLIAQDAATQQQVDTQKALVNQLAATVKTDAAAVQAAQVQLSYTHIVAPISGRVGARLADPGNIVHAADTTGIVVINQVDPITVVFTLPDDAFQDVNRALNEHKNDHRAPQVLAFSRDGNQKLATGELILLNNAIDTATGTISMKARFKNPTHTLWPGQYVNVRLVLGTRGQALTVPSGVVQRGQDGLYAYVVGDDNKAKLQPIEVLQTQDGVSVVTKGLSAGQRVVLDGQYKLKPGSQVVEAKPAPAKPGMPASSGGGTPGDASPSQAPGQVTTGNRSN